MDKEKDALSNKPDTLTLKNSLPKEPLFQSRLVSTRSLELETAIENIQKIASMAESEGPPNLSAFTIVEGRLQAKEQSSISTTIALTRRWLIVKFSKEGSQALYTEQQAVRHKLLQSIETLKIYLSTFENMKKGSESQQKLAEKMLATATQYNFLVDRAKRAPTSWTQKIKRFFLKKMGWSLEEDLIETDIHISEKASSLYETTNLIPCNAGLHAERLKTDPSLPVKDKVTSVFVKRPHSIEALPVTPRPEEVDAFRMKAISMIQNQQGNAMLPDTLKSIRQAHLISQMHMLEQKNSSFKGPIISLSQIITPLPGEEIHVEGSFLRDLQMPEMSIPLPDSFRLCASSTQSGFPHPSQHISWSLNEKLLPPYPFRPLRMPLIAQVLKKKEEIARYLLPKEKLNNKAKMLYEIRKNTFHTYLDELLPQLQCVLKSLCAAAQIPAEKNAEKAIDDLLEQAAKLTNCFDWLSKTHMEISHQFIATAYEGLQQEWLMGEHLIPAEDSLHSSSQLAMNILEKYTVLSTDYFTHQKNRAENTIQFTKAHYQLTIGQIVSKASNLLILQNLSELINCAPPLQTAFSQATFLSALYQFHCFSEELGLPIETIKKQGNAWMRERLLLMMNTEASLFKNMHETPSSIAQYLILAQEAQNYYAERFSRKIALKRHHENG